MNPLYKLFAAAVLVGGGFGVARMLGQPVARSYAPQSGDAQIQQQLATLPGPTLPSVAPVLNQWVRLMPDFGATHLNKAEADPPPTDVPPLLSAADSAAARVAVPVLPEPTQQIVSSKDAPAANRLSQTNMSPRATLRNEAPRPLVVEQTPRTSPSPQAEFPHAAESTATIRASHESSDSQVVAAYDAPQLAPPPWGAPDEAESPRTHIIIDGDSLARLAGRYLGDPRRRDEIYELNRGVLTSPELLPIGMELVIPVRSGTPALDSQMPQSLAPRSVAIHAAAHNGLVPVRPIPPSAGTMPRAQLLRPVPVE